MQEITSCIYLEVVPNCCSLTPMKAVLSSASRLSATVKKEFPLLFSCTSDCSFTAVSSCKDSFAMILHSACIHSLGCERKLVVVATNINGILPNERIDGQTLFMQSLFIYILFEFVDLVDVAATAACWSPAPEGTQYPHKLVGFLKLNFFYT
jgi:hypothetical protein